jgi:hypothetical protein
MGGEEVKLVRAIKIGHGEVRKYIVIAGCLTALAGLSGCANTPENRAAWEQISGAMQQMGQQMQQAGREALQDSPKTTNCYRTYMGASCTTY